MTGEGTLQPSSWKAEAIRRGDLKISGPFPITEETPLNEEEEKAYAGQQNHGPPPFSPDTSSHPPPVRQDEEPHPAPEQPDDQPLPPHGESHHLEHKRSSTGLRQVSENQARSSQAPMPQSTPSPFPSIPESSSKMTTPNRKKRKSGLRNAFRKMFGRRSRQEPVEEEEEVARKHAYHRSDPGSLTAAQERRQEPTNGPGISDMPVPELAPVNPLGQHLPFPMNVNAPQETSPPHEYLTFDVPSPDVGRRRATLPSLLLSPHEAQVLRGAISGSVEKLATWNERHDGDSIPSPQIGVALSSPPPLLGAHSVQQKRRSRSAGALRELAKTARPSVERRRSAEIRYWRQSYQSGSIYSSATRPQTAKTVETVRSMETQDAATHAPEPGEETSVVREPAGVAQHEQDISQIPIPVEAFNFGNLKTGFSDDEHEEEPEAPTRSSEKRLSIEDRVRHLEDNMRDLETSVRRISGRNNRQTIILENAPKGRRSRTRSSSTTSDRQGSHHSSKGSSSCYVASHTRPADSGPPSPALGPLSAVDEFPSSAARAHTMVLEPNAMMHRPTTAQRTEISDQISALSAALQHERTARKALVEQVNNLQREVSDLHALVIKFMAQSPSYPTPSPDAIVTRNEERLSTPRAKRANHHGLGFDHDVQRNTIVSRFSHSAESSVASSREDVTSPEAWMTPKEEPGFGSGFFASNQQSRSRTNVGGDRGAVDDDDEMF